MRIARYYQKTLFGLFALMGIIVAATSILYVNTIDRQLSGDFVTDSKSIARIIADSNVELIVNQRYSALQTIIDQFVGVGGISYVFVVDETGTIIAHTFVPGIPKEISADFRENRPLYDRKIKGLGNFTEVTAPVLAGVAGRVHVGMANGHIALRVQTAIGKQVYLLSIIFVFSILTTYVLMHLVSRPLHWLGDYARRHVSTPDHEEPPHADTEKRLMRRADEIGEIGRLIRALIR